MNKNSKLINIVVTCGFILFGALLSMPSTVFAQNEYFTFDMDSPRYYMFGSFEIVNELGGNKYDADLFLTYESKGKLYDVTQDCTVTDNGAKVTVKCRNAKSTGGGYNPDNFYLDKKGDLYWKGISIDTAGKESTTQFFQLKDLHGGQLWSSSWGPVAVKADETGHFQALYNDARNGLIDMNTKDGVSYSGYWARQCAAAERGCGSTQATRNGKSKCWGQLWGNVNSANTDFKGRWNYCGKKKPTGRWDGRRVK